MSRLGPHAFGRQGESLPGRSIIPHATRRPREGNGGRGILWGASSGQCTRRNPFARASTGGDAPIGHSHPRVDRGSRGDAAGVRILGEPAARQPASVKASIRLGHRFRGCNGLVDFSHPQASRRSPKRRRRGNPGRPAVGQRRGERAASPGRRLAPFIHAWIEYPGAKRRGRRAEFGLVGPGVPTSAMLSGAPSRLPMPAWWAREVRQIAD